MKRLTSTLLSTICLLALAQSAHAQTYQMQIASSGLKASVATPPAPAEPPAPPPAVCSPGSLVLSTAGETSWEMPAGCTEVSAKVWGAGGGSFSTSPTGGAGGFTGGTLALASGTTLTLRVGLGGSYNSTLYTNSGGGLSGIWLADVPVLVAGGGGGAGKTGRGGAAGQNGEGLYFAGKGATAIAPGQGGCGNSAGTDWAGGTVKARLSGTPSGDGGAGRFGGGAGCAQYYNGMYIGGTGGGGSNYIADTVQNAVSLYGGYATPGNHADVDRGTGGSPKNAGRIVLSYR